MRSPHVMVSLFEGDDASPDTVAKLNDKGHNFLHSGRGATTRDAMLALASLLEGLAAEIRSAADVGTSPRVAR
jgi:hypothetical protein